MIKVLVADDQELLRESLRIILSANNNIEVVDTVCNGTEVLESINTNIPDVILMDVRMPEMDGVTCTKIVKERYPQVKVIVLTTFDDDEYIYDALRYGASGYLLKGVSMQGLISGINTVLNGGTLINPDVATKFVRLVSEITYGNKIKAFEGEKLDNIGDAELRIIKLVGKGFSNKEIAHDLFLSEGTIRNYLSQILSKLELRDRTQLAIWAIETGVVYNSLGGSHEAK